MKVDVLIIGGGPAGLAAAYEVAGRGAKTALVDDSWSLGGQLRQQTQVLKNLVSPYTGLRGYELARKLIERLASLPVEVFLQHAMIGVYADQSIGVSDDRTLTKISAASIIVATGAAETPVAFPNWTMPGIITVGAAQILINRERVYPGYTTIIFGSSDLALEVAAQLQAVGIEVVAIVDNSAKVRAVEQENLAYFDKAGIPVYLQAEFIEVQENKLKKHLAIRKEDNSILEYEVDFVCLDGGRHPIIEPPAVLNCSLSYRPQLGGWLPDYNPCCQSSQKHVFVAGNTSGLTCHAGLLLTGALAGIGAADYLNLADSQTLQAQRTALWQALYGIESANYPPVWQERVAHLSDFLETKLSDNPGNWPEPAVLRR
jgi:NADPH-dependent 2,4-dienoyl-CoA reductase/sulfur reductase-like enzyme